MASAQIEILLNNGTHQLIEIDAEMGKKVSEYVFDSNPIQIVVKDEAGSLVVLRLDQIAALTVKITDR